MQNGTISASLGDVSGSVLTKSTTGTVTTSNASTYTGVTNVNAGSLLLNSGSLLGSGSVSVAGPATFGGRGSAGSVSVDAGGTIQGGYSGSGSLSLAALTFNGAGSLYLGGLASYTSSPAIAVAGGLSTNGGNSITITVGSLAGTTTGVGYQLLGYNSIGGTGSGAFQLGTLPNRAVGQLSNIGNSIDLTLTIASDYLHWSGSFSTAWDTSTANWTLNSSGGTAIYMDTPNPDTVVFDDRAGATPL